MNRRSSGILLHITSLPSPYGIGDFGTGAYKFVDFLAETKQGFWQILPLNPTDSALGNSPYYSPSAFASNTILISPELLFQSGLLEKEDLDTHPSFHEDRVDYHKAITYKKQLFCRAHERFKRKANTYEYEKFCKENSFWLENFALFIALKERFHGQLWNQWPSDIRDRRPETLQSLKKQHHDKIEFEKFLQFIFSRQWSSLKEYSNNRGIQIIGDIPIYVCFDSADVWAHPDLFKLNENKQPLYVAGVPPDYFSATGQYWGNPVYQWERMKETGYQWWIQRIQRNITLFDMMRIDHFRGFVAYWEIPSTERTAVNGRWVEAPVENFITTLLKHFSHLPFIAEDLGVITPDVKEIIQRFGFPGMRILLFAFGEDLPTNPYTPHNYIRDCVAYTGTHDNNTVKGWFEREAAKEDKERLYRYLGREISALEVNGELIRIVMMSAASLVLFPMQDILGLGEDARMNRPSIAEGNWTWRLLSTQITPSLIQKLRDMTEIYGRT